MKTYYKVTLKVEESQLPTVLGVLAPEVKMLSAEQMAAEAAAPEPASSGKRYLNGKRNKGISGKKLMEEIFDKSERSTDTQIRKAFAARGFSENSVSPYLSKAFAAGKIKNVGRGVYEKV
jgi:hypothetical protein